MLHLETLIDQVKILMGRISNRDSHLNASKKHQGIRPFNLWLNYPKVLYLSILTLDF